MEESTEIEEPEDKGHTEGEIQVAPEPKFNLGRLLKNTQKAKQVALAVETDEEDPVVAKITVSAKDTKPEGFEKAQEREIEQWRKKKVMEAVNNEDVHTIETTWVFTKKIHASGKEKEKARLVARGFQDEMDEV